MESENKRLVEVECILKKLESKYINKIPKEIWNFIEQNKDKEYIYKYDESKALEDQDLNIDTIAILTYINMEYLLNEKEKSEIQEILKIDEQIAEKEKKEKYNIDNIFKENSNDVKPHEEELNQLIEPKESTIKRIWNKILFLIHIKK